MSSGGQQERESGCGCALTDAIEAPAAGLRSQAFHLGFALALLPMLMSQVSKCLEVHRTTPFKVSTTFPVFCPVSTYRVASTTSSSG